MLRNPDYWPASFGPWNYAGWSTCAIGLAYQAGLLETAGWNYEFNLPPRDFDAIFANVGPFATTPEHVADRIDNHLTRERERLIENRRVFA